MNKADKAIKRRFRRLVWRLVWRASGRHACSCSLHKSGSIWAWQGCEAFQVVDENEELLRVLQIVNDVIGERAVRQDARTPARPEEDTWHNGYQHCAGLLRGRLRRLGYFTFVSGSFEASISPAQARRWMDCSSTRVKP